MNLYLFFAILICSFCNARETEMLESGSRHVSATQARTSLENDVCSILKSFIEAHDNKNSRERALQFAKLKELSVGRKNNSDIDQLTAALANTILSKDDFSENYAKKLTFNKWINISTTAFLGSLWISAFKIYNLHDFEKNSPLLALTGASFVGTLGTVLPDNLIQISTVTKCMVVATAFSLWWFTLVYSKPQELPKPFDLLIILFPITAGVTKRILIEPGIDWLSRYSAGIGYYKPFNGGQNAS